MEHISSNYSEWFVIRLTSFDLTEDGVRPDTVLIVGLQVEERPVICVLPRAAPCCAGYGARYAHIMVQERTNHAHPI